MNFKKSILQFSIRKLSIGVASIAIGSIFMNASIASANTNTPSQRVNSNANTSTISTVHSKEISQNNPIQPITETKQTQKIEKNKPTAPDILTLTGKLPNDTSSIKQNQPMEKVEVKETAKEHQAVRNLTQADALKISKGELHSENHLIDQSLYGEKPLNPEGDDDHDGIKNKDEIYIYRKNNKEYVGYHSHPLLEDSDGDGLRDNEDDNKKQWYMTDRDAIFFMNLAYQDETSINKVLDHSKPYPSLFLKEQEFKMMHNELAPFWKLKKSYHTTSGMDAFLFETKSDLAYLKDNTVQMLAIRGTNPSEMNDLTADLVLFGGNKPAQADDIRNVVRELAKDSSITNLYMTGHSLGGYLAQIAAVEAYQIL